MRNVLDRQVIEIKAEAQRDGEILRGEGEGERNGIFADAFGRDPEFFEFYRSMSAYSEALKESGTTMVLSPDSYTIRSNIMSDLIVAIGLVFVIEGVLYAAFPNAMRKMVQDITKLPDTNIRTIGIFALVIGVIIVWAVRG